MFVVAPPICGRRRRVHATSGDAQSEEDSDIDSVDSDGAAQLDQKREELDDPLRSENRLEMRNDRTAALPRCGAKSQKSCRGGVTPRIAALLRSTGAGRWEILRWASISM
jgi:hypothetical protein